MFVSRFLVLSGGRCPQDACASRKSCTSRIPVHPGGLCCQKACAARRPVLPEGQCCQKANVSKTQMF